MVTLDVYHDLVFFGENGPGDRVVPTIENNPRLEGVGMISDSCLIAAASQGREQHGQLAILVERQEAERLFHSRGPVGPISGGGSHQYNSIPRSAATTRQAETA